MASSAAAAPVTCHGVDGQPKLLIVISNWRTGSTLLSKILHSHPDINLGPTPWSAELFRQQERGFKDLEWPDSMRAVWNRRFSAPAEYLEAAISRRRQSRPDAAVIGHKFQVGWLTLPGDTSDYHVRREDFEALFMRNASWCKVLLYRCDAVAQYASFVRARGSGHWLNSSACSGPEVRLNLNGFRVFKDLQDSHHSGLLHAVARSRKTSLVV